MDGQTNRPKPICPFNFFEVGGITMHKCTSYVPDKLNLRPFYHLTFKCDLDLQPTNLRIFFTKNPTNLKKKKNRNCFFFLWGGGGGEGVEGGPEEG